MEALVSEEVCGLWLFLVVIIIIIIIIIILLLLLLIYSITPDSKDPGRVKTKLKTQLAGVALVQFGGLLLLLLLLFITDLSIYQTWLQDTQLKSSGVVHKPAKLKAAPASSRTSTANIVMSCDFITWPASCPPLQYTQMDNKTLGHSKASYPLQTTYYIFYITPFTFSFTQHDMICVHYAITNWRTENQLIGRTVHTITLKRRKHSVSADLCQQINNQPTNRRQTLPPWRKTFAQWTRQTGVTKKDITQGKVKWWEGRWVVLLRYDRKSAKILLNIFIHHRVAENNMHQRTV